MNGTELKAAAAEPSKWRRLMTAIEDLGTWAKMVALLLAVAGFLAIYFPGLRRAYELRVMPAAWYNVVMLSNPWSKPHPFMDARPRGYESPAWADGLNSTVLYSLPGQMIYSAGTAVGREGPSVFTGVASIYDKNTCLFVRDLHFSVYRRKNDSSSSEARTSLSSLSGTGLAAHASLISKIPADLQAMPEGSCIGESDARKLRQVGKPVALPICPRIAVWAKAQKVSC